MNTVGALSEQSASHLMKVLFGARMAHPIMSISIQRLARYVTKWTAECDRRLHRLFCFFFSYEDWILTAEVRECTDV